MTTDKQIDANRRNAKKITGPRSQKGSAISRQNARRHGLAIDVGHDPAFQDDIVNLTCAFSGCAPRIGADARQAAEAQLALSRIRNIRANMIDLHYFAGNLRAEGLAKLNENLAKLERYERRAYSKRKRALRAISLAL